ncbi:hypothetical protein QCA50_000470 [Cerrena zonata]|uniref:Uncharacterized protein n=1 Tax=Cerrena zonata TaxID=2478898 RepID=A0AAW0GZ32_9APHY
MSMLPHFEDAKTVAITISDFQWQEVLSEREEDQQGEEQTNTNGPTHDDSIYVSGEDIQPVVRKGDWAGVERDRRSAYLIVGGLRMEDLL